MRWAIVRDDDIIHGVVETATEDDSGVHPPEGMKHFKVKEGVDCVAGWQWNNGDCLPTETCMMAECLNQKLLLVDQYLEEALIKASPALQNAKSLREALMKAKTMKELEAIDPSGGW